RRAGGALEADSRHRPGQDRIGRPGAGRSAAFHRLAGPGARGSQDNRSEGHRGTACRGPGGHVPDGAVRETRPSVAGEPVSGSWSATQYALETPVAAADRPRDELAHRLAENTRDRA